MQTRCARCGCKIDTPVTLTDAVEVALEYRSAFPDVHPHQEKLVFICDECWQEEEGQWASGNE